MKPLFCYVWGYLIFNATLSLSTTSLSNCCRVIVELKNKWENSWWWWKLIVGNLNKWWTWWYHIEWCPRWLSRGSTSTKGGLCLFLSSQFGDRRKVLCFRSSSRHSYIRTRKRCCKFIVFELFGRAMVCTGWVDQPGSGVGFLSFVLGWKGSVCNPETTEPQWSVCYSLDLGVAAAPHSGLSGGERGLGWHQIHLMLIEMLMPPSVCGSFSVVPWGGGRLVFFHLSGVQGWFAAQLFWLSEAHVWWSSSGKQSLLWVASVMRCRSGFGLAWGWGWVWGG